MDDIFGLGFGPFRWVCTSADPEDLKKTDIIAEDVMQESLKNIPNELKSNYQDNLRWI
jgi:urocanate hydratase